ncbi:GGDEF domain-containing protein [Aliarcobacter butzleri]|nr:GGDEF domain-containing protein [Aliarcobacter butzleri]
MGKTLKNSFLRSTDYAFRIGGEEFEVLFDVNDFKDASIIMERVRKKIEDLKIEASPKSNYKYLTVSIGLGNILKLDINTNPSIIYHEVDKLLYKSKKGVLEIPCQSDKIQILRVDNGTRDKL